MSFECEREWTNDLLRVVADVDRRRVIRYLSSRSSDTASLSELADAVASQRTTSDTKRITIQLHHAVVPALQDAGLVEYDPHSRMVRYHSTPAVEALLDHVREMDR